MSAQSEELYNPNSVFELHLVPPAEAGHPTLGFALEQSANAATLTRVAGGIVLNRYIERTPGYQSWKTCAAFVLLAATDAEGALARLGRKLQGDDESKRRPLNAYADQLADKGLIDSTMKAIAHQEGQTGDPVYASMVNTAADITIARDVVTTGDRIIADFQNIDTRAQKSGKLKALKQYVVTGFALSPLATSRPVKWALGGAFLYTAKDSVTSGWSLHQSFSDQRKARKLAPKPS